MAGRTTLIIVVLSASRLTICKPCCFQKDFWKILRNAVEGSYGGKWRRKEITSCFLGADYYWQKGWGLGIKDLVKHNEAFILKLCWKLLNNPNALWVSVLGSKYRCASNLTHYIRKGRGASLTWRSTCDVWDKFLNGLGMKVGNGEITSFWYDNWSQLNTPLVHFIPSYERFTNKEERVANYINPRGKWDVEKLGR